MNIRHPRQDEGGQVYQLIRKAPPLDLNSEYLYHLLCIHHRLTCALAEEEGQIIGFVSSYLKPEEPDCVFIWQVAVAEAHRGKGVAGKLLDWLTSAAPLTEVRHLETTIGPTNLSSAALFQKLAQRHGAQVRKSSFIGTHQFSEPGHEEETLYHISPIQRTLA